MSSFRYIPASLVGQLNGLQIDSIFACADQATEVSALNSSGSPKTNHWVLYCGTVGGKFICIDPSPAGTDLSIALIVTEKDKHTTNAVKIIQLQTLDLTVTKLIGLIENNKYDKYQFSSSGQGCRYWIRSLIHLLKSHGHIIAQSEVMVLESALENVWDANGSMAPDSEQTPISKGNFYALE